MKLMFIMIKIGVPAVMAVCLSCCSGHTAGGGNELKCRVMEVEGGTGPDKSTYKNENLGNTTDKHDYYPFINKWTEYAFIPDGHSDETFKSIDPEKRSIYLPNHIEDGKIIMGQQLLFFINQGKYYKEDELRYKHFEVDIVGMKWNIYTSTIYYKRLQVTFTATLSRPGSDTKKVLKGKFMQRYPYDCSEIHHEVKDSLED